MNGNLISGVDIEISFHRFVEKILNGKRFDEKEEKITEKIKSMNEPTPFEISFSEDGTYSITALIKDNQNNEIYSTKNFWVSSGEVNHHQDHQH